MRFLALGAVLALASPARAQDGGVPPEAGPDEEPPLSVAGPPPYASAAERDRWLASRLKEALASRPALARAKVGVAILDSASGRVLVSQAANDLFQVASVAKLVTSAAALSILGPEYRYRTIVYAGASPLGWDGRDTIRGDLWLRGAGDPTLSSEVLMKLATELRLLGVKKVTGSLVIDDSFFDGVTSPPLYEQKKEDAAYRAPVSAASLNYSSVLVQVHPGAKAGEPARVIVDPGSEYFVIENSATTVAKGRTSVKVVTAVVEGQPQRLSLKISGTVRADAEILYLRKRVEHPDLYAGETFRALLQAQGVRIAGKLVKKGIVPETARALASSTSEPLTVLIRDLNKYSNNFMAEALLKTIGAEAGGPPGTWPKGLEAVRSWLAGIGLKDGTFRYDNGSGLYDSNRFTPLQIATILRQAYRDFRVSPDFVSALSIAGADGTLGNRMLGTAAERYVRAKSGTLRNVSSLAGYAGSVGKPPLVFVILVNDLPEEWEAGRAARSLQDELAQAMVLYLETAR